MKFSKIIAIGALAMASMGAMAQAQLTVSTGDSKLTYSKMFREFQKICKDQIPMVEVASTGSVQNLNRLVDNEVNAAIVQTDYLFYTSRNQDLSNVKTLFSMHPEEVHIITQVVSPIKEGGTMGIGKKSIQINRVDDLNNRLVAAWGGSVDTAKIIKGTADINYTVVPMKDLDAAKVALDAGDIAAIIMVGGQPIDGVKALGEGYKLLPFSETAMAKLKSVYVPAKLNYNTMGAGGQGIPTIATEALFVTWSYKSPKFNDSMKALRKCFDANLETLQETTGNHKKWRDVKAENSGKWSAYNFSK